jgi:hypothetical protein
VSPLIVFKIHFRNDWEADASVKSTVSPWYVGLAGFWKAL